MESRENLLFGFFLAGCSMASLCSHNIMYSDFHDGNVVVDESGRVNILDMDDVDIVAFPDEIRSYAKAIMNFYSHFDINLGAAFRFGFIHVAGEVGKILYDILYNENDLTCLFSKNHSVPLNLDVYYLKNRYREWNKLINNSFIRKYTHESYNYDDYYFFDIMRKNDVEYHTFKEKYKENILILRHEYQTYLANSLYSGNEFDFVSAVLTLSEIEFFDGNDILACYYYNTARETLLANSDDERFEGHIQTSMRMAYRLAKKYGVDEINTILKNITFETFRLRSKEVWINRYLEIWYWSDYIKEFSIDELKRTVDYAFFKCNECQYIDFYEKSEPSCLRCYSKNVVELTKDEYIYALYKDYSDKSKKQTFGNIDLPVLNSVDMIPSYVYAIDLYEKNERYEKAIEIAKIIEKFLLSNPQIKDDQGYVLVKSNESGNIFRDQYDPDLLMKIFHLDIKFVRSDYEALISYKLCKLYEKLDNTINALEYAKKIVELSNNSFRWIENRFVEHAYTYLYRYEKQLKNNADALKLANIIFVYDLLRKLKNNKIKDFIEMITKLGEDNACSGNIALAYTCFLYSLRNHIYHYGIRHPNSARIYANIANLYAIKKQYSISYGYYAMALKLLEKSRNHKYVEMSQIIEREITEWLIKSQYQDSYQEWKNKWVTDDAFDIFPEERFVKDNHNINLSSTEKLVTYDG